MHTAGVPMARGQFMLLARPCNTELFGHTKKTPQVVGLPTAYLGAPCCSHPPEEPTFGPPWRARRLAAEARPGAIRRGGGACTGLQPLVAGCAPPLELARLAHKNEARASTTTPARARTLPNAAHKHAAPARTADRAIFHRTAVFFGCTGPNER